MHDLISVDVFLFFYVLCKLSIVTIRGLQTKIGL